MAMLAPYLSLPPTPHPPSLPTSHPTPSFSPYLPPHTLLLSLSPTPHPVSPMSSFYQQETIRDTKKTEMKPELLEVQFVILRVGLSRQHCLWGSSNCLSVYNNFMPKQSPAARSMALSLCMTGRESCSSQAKIEGNKSLYLLYAVTSVPCTG